MVFERCGGVGVVCLRGCFVCGECVGFEGVFVACGIFI